MILMLVMFVVFWFMLIRPQQKRARELQEMLRSLKKGDQVVTSGGIIGRITGVAENDTVIILEVQEKVRMRILRSAIQAKHQALEAVAEKGDKADKADKAEKLA